MSLVQILTDARQKYAEHPSHVPPGEYPEFPTVCAVTALDRAYDYTTDPVEAEALLCQAADLNIDPARLGYFGSGRRPALIEWNAKASTEKVLAAFDKAIELAK